MDILEFDALYQYELMMTTLWRKVVSGQESCLKLFDLQERLGFEECVDNHVLGGRIRDRYMNVGFHLGTPVICFHAESFLKQYENSACSLSALQRDELRNMMLLWDHVPQRSGVAVYSFTNHDLSWLPSPEEVLSLGIIGLYDLYRTEKACYARIPEYIHILNKAIDRYKYLACRAMVENSENPNMRRIYEALGRVKYQPPVNSFQALQILLLHCQIFRPDHLNQFDCMMSRFFQEPIFRDEGELSFFKGTARDFFSRYMYCVHSTGRETSVTFEDQIHHEFCDLLREIIDNMR